VGFENATFVWKPRSGMEKRDQALGVKPCDLFIGLDFKPLI